MTLCWLIRCFARPPAVACYHAHIINGVCTRCKRNVFKKRRFRR